MVVLAPQEGVGYDWMAKPDGLVFAALVALSVLPWGIVVPRPRLLARIALAIVIAVAASVHSAAAAFPPLLDLYTLLVLYMGVHASYAALSTRSPGTRASSIAPDTGW